MPSQSVKPGSATGMLRAEAPPRAIARRRGAVDSGVPMVARRREALVYRAIASSRLAVPIDEGAATTAGIAAGEERSLETDTVAAGAPGQCGASGAASDGGRAGGYHR